MFYFDQDDYDAVLNVMKSNKLFRYQGPNVSTECSNFEKEFSDYLGGGFTVALSSGTNALITALKIFDIGSDDEVIVPAYTFFATISSVLQVGATPIVVNVDEKLGYDLNELKSKIGPKTKAIIMVHMDGVAEQVESILEIAKENTLFLIEDVAQAAGGVFSNSKLGTFGDAGCFSFNVDKNITCGEGGAIFVKDIELYQKAMLYHDGCNQFGPTLKDFYTIDKFVGASMRISEIQGALLRSQLKKLPMFTQLAKKRYSFLSEKLLEAGYSLLENANDENVIGTVVRLRLNNNVNIKDAIISLNKIGVRALTSSMRPAHNPWQWCQYLKGNLYRNKMNYLTTVNYLSATLLIYIDFNLKESEWQKRVEDIISELNKCRKESI